MHRYKELASDYYDASAGNIERNPPYKQHSNEEKSITTTDVKITWFIISV